MKKKIVIGISGSTGVILGVRALQMLREVPDVETHLVLSRAGALNLQLETNYTAQDVRALADVVHGFSDIGAPIASGSFRADAMIVVPCSMKTLSGIAHSYADNLLVRAADVMLKERRTLVLAVRETPLHLGHLRLLTQAAELGAVIFPPVPAFYHRPENLEDVIDQSVGRMLDQVGIELPALPRWPGTAAAAAAAASRRLVAPEVEGSPPPVDGGLHLEMARNGAGPRS
ncbi:UbiX family flavin prenyltransferase [Arthrobacter bambusae]|uniref:Flavin prenyltransferase UbiX n=1 Tax=Arthrobacter bambusae TaxID=1338426 RepID=A0AAW8DKT0_9MICC|nr:UbiX family flavin prenyltransferase [Arthrobacter bambusae]MDP9906194.1 4-hydroxy-3-polyprenylbenzoate decarboxylase [Arthrobacter bambusae]MDQ0130573.1 4-hydroxy-3-polyprenylbenzoate decarboxylase [Arthrobacter bambusae]MDQ0182248.1 4-hydroxy-3-polyprenylbenzoate decarboxylase [Arthrobacter bambusae]